MSSGNLEPGGNFSPSGTIATYASDVVAPALLEGVVKDAMLELALQIVQGQGVPDLISSIIESIGE